MNNPVDVGSEYSNIFQAPLGFFLKFFPHVLQMGVELITHGDGLMYVICSLATYELKRIDSDYFAEE